MRVGTSVPLRERRFPAWDHPHACGDKILFHKFLILSPGSSPCVWGQAGAARRVWVSSGIIPMRVGTR